MHSSRMRTASTLTDPGGGGVERLIVEAKEKDDSDTIYIVCELY